VRGDRRDGGSLHAWLAGMAAKVEEIMNHELLALRASDDVDQALGYLLSMGVSGAPVVDSDGLPIGVVSLRDLLGKKPGSQVSDRMTSPAVVIPRTASIEAAAQSLSEHGIHRLIVIDEQGMAVGVVSTLDCMRGLCGIPASHPLTFPHYDRLSGLTWTDDLVFSREKVELAPSGPGILVLRVGGAGRYETDVWIEPASDLKARLRDMLVRPQEDRRLSQLLERYGKYLRFRACAIPDPARRYAALQHLKGTRQPWTVVHVPNAT
jgi:CBS domain-containing protein